MAPDPDPETASAAAEVARSLADPAFLAALCHDLRGPLGALGMWVHVLGSERADATTRQQALSAIQRDIAAESRLIEQVSDLSAILGGSVRPTLEELDLGSLLAELRIALQTDLASPRVLADRKHLRQLLAILLASTEGAGGAAAPTVVVAAGEEPGLLSCRGSFRKEGPGLVALTLARALALLQSGALATTRGPEGQAFTIQLRTPVL